MAFVPIPLGVAYLVLGVPPRALYVTFAWARGSLSSISIYLPIIFTSGLASLQEQLTKPKLQLVEVE